jgi:hypothetical protein
MTWSSPTRCSTVSQWADAACKATQGRRPVWLIPQLHDNTSYGRQAPERGANPPTAAQQRCMVYLCLAHGAKGIVWYTWDDGPNMGAKYHPEQHQTLRELCQEISALAPLLQSGSPRQFVTAEGRLHGLVVVAPAGRRLLVVNPTTEPVSATIDVPEATGGQPFTPLAGGPSVPATDQRLTVELGALEARVLSF